MIKNKTDKATIPCAVGRRKSAIANVKLLPGKGKFISKDKSKLNENQVGLVFYPLSLVDKDKSFDIVAHVRGGGVQSQVEAIKLAVARATVQIDADAKTVLRSNGLLTRDNRVKERKKPGLRRARRAPQWAKR